MTDQEILNLIDATWETMWHTVGQDQWPCDVLMRLRGELLTGRRSYSTKELNKQLPEMLELVVDPGSRDAFEKIVQAVLTRRSSRKRR